MMYLSETSYWSKAGGKYIFLFILMTSMLTFLISSAMASPADSIEVIAKHPESAANSIYQVKFSVSKPVPSNAIFRVTFPQEFDLSDLLIAGSTTINGGFEISVDKQVVVMKRSGLGKELPANQTADLKFAIVKNPGTPADDYKILIEILDGAEKSIIRAEKNQKIFPRSE
jgi:hypothetical protein